MNLIVVPIIITSLILFILSGNLLIYIGTTEIIGIIFLPIISVYLLLYKRHKARYFHWKNDIRVTTLSEIDIPESRNTKQYELIGIASILFGFTIFLFGFILNIFNIRGQFLLSQMFLVIGFIVSFGVTWLVNRSIVRPTEPVMELTDESDMRKKRTHFWINYGFSILGMGFALIFLAGLSGAFAEIFTFGLTLIEIGLLIQVLNGFVSVLNEKRGEPEFKWLMMVLLGLLLLLVFFSISILILYLVLSSAEVIMTIIGLLLFGIIYTLIPGFVLLFVGIIVLSWKYKYPLEELGSFLIPL